MLRKKPLSRRGKHWISAILTGVGGFVDVVGYIALAQIFTANMSGNSIHIGQYAVDHEGHDLFGPAIAVLSYVAALVIARIVIEIGARRHIASIATWTLLIEFVLLIVVILAGSPFIENGRIPHSSGMRYALTGILAFAMGTQTVTLTRIGPLTVYTTFVTGTLTKFAQRFSIWIFRVYDQRETSLRELLADKDFRDSIFLTLIWVAYVAGAVIGVICKKEFELRALTLPVLVILVMICLDYVRPMSLEEERE